MATLKSYRQWGKDYGLEFVEFTDLTDNLLMHYTSVRPPSRHDLFSRVSTVPGKATPPRVAFPSGTLFAWPLTSGRRRKMCHY